jgi:hypothetical protein
MSTRWTTAPASIDLMIDSMRVRISVPLCAPAGGRGTEILHFGIVEAGRLELGADPPDIRRSGKGRFDRDAAGEIDGQVQTARSE